MPKPILTNPSKTTRRRVRQRTGFGTRICEARDHPCDITYTVRYWNEEYLEESFHEWCMHCYVSYRAVVFGFTPEEITADLRRLIDRDRFDG